MNLLSITASLKCIFKEFTDNVDGFPNQVLKMSDLLLFFNTDQNVSLYTYCYYSSDKQQQNIKSVVIIHLCTFSPFD